MSLLQFINTSLPANYSSQENLLGWAEKIITEKNDFRKFQFLVKRSGIAGRYSVVPDFSNNGKSLLYHQNPNGDPPTTTDRIDLFKPAALKLGLNAAEKCILESGIDTGSLTHLITVSCTGLSAPGLEIEISNQLKLSPYIERSTVNFMGCYAAFHAIKQANYICKANPEAKVLVVSAECCTLHFRNTGREDDLLSTAIFGDGAAAFLMSGDYQEQAGFHLVDQRSQLIYATDEMSWDVKNDGFEMRLSRDVPGFIEANIKDLYGELSRRNGIDKYDYFAIHPGGKNILEAFKRSIGLNQDDLRHSYSTLKNYGNMSSPTVLFVLKEVLEEFKASGLSEASVFSAAFGPGLTLETAIFRLTRNT